MANRIHLTSFYGVASQNDPHWSDRQMKLHQSALSSGGVDAVIPWNAEKLGETDFAGNNQQILQLKRGYGYWLWKPYIILHALQNIDEGDYVLYHDVGRPQRDDPTRGYTLDRDISPLVRWADANQGIYPGVYMPHHGRQKHWTKRDCFVLMDCDEEKYWNATQVQATYNVWKNTPAVHAFVKEWLAYCQHPAILTDQENTKGLENFPGFKEHRHDQSILTNLCIKRGINVYGSPTQSTLLHRNLNSLIRHAKFDELVKQKKNILRQTIAEESPHRFDRGTIRWLELFYCERRESALSVLLIGEHDLAIWERYMPNAVIEHREDVRRSGEDLANNKDSTKQARDLVVINATNFPQHQFDLVVKLFPLITVSGLLVCGKVRAEWDKLPKDHRSGLALMRDFWSNKAVTHPGVSVSQKQELDNTMLMAFSSWEGGGETGHTYFVRYDS